MVLLVYVDDLILASNNSNHCRSFKSFLARRFHIKDLGILKYFLGIEIARSPSGLFLSQHKYTLDILNESGMLGARPTSFPMEQQHHLSFDSGDPIPSLEQYHRLVRQLIYLTITRLELCYYVHLLSQFSKDPWQSHWHAVMRVLRYLKQSPRQRIILSTPSLLQLTAYCDSDWASCPMTRRSVSGYFITLGGCPVSWKTKKQTSISRSSAEAKYRAMADTTSKLIWLWSLLQSLGVDHFQAMQLFCDNQATLHIAYSPIFHERTKHIEIDYHFVRDHLEHQDIVTSHVPTKLQLANIFTKALGRDRFQFLLNKLDVWDLHTPTWGGILE